jgi:hypothetical protein
VHIPLASRNFLPDRFHDMGLERWWDVVNVSRPIRLKRVDQFLAAVRLAYDQGHRLRVLVVCPVPFEIPTDRSWYGAIYDDYLRLFDAAERETVTLLMLRGDGYPFPLSQTTLAWLLNTAKALALFSEQEGEARTVAEALACGTPVVVRRDVRGGADDYLDEANSRRFGSVEEAAAALVELAGPDAVRIPPGRHERDFLERHNAPRLRSLLVERFADRGLSPDGDWDLVGLDRKLPSHRMTLPRSMCHPQTDDLASPAAALAYIGDLLGEDVSGPVLARARARWRLERSSARVRGGWGRARFWLGAQRDRVLRRGQR